MYKQEITWVDAVSLLRYILIACGVLYQQYAQEKQKKTNYGAFYFCLIWEFLLKYLSVYLNFISLSRVRYI